MLASDAVVVAALVGSSQLILGVIDDWIGSARDEVRRRSRYLISSSDGFDY